MEKWGNDVVKHILLFLVFLSFAFAQVDLSTPGGEFVYVSITSEPIGAEIYISDTFVGNAPVIVKINAATPTTFKALIQGSEYQVYSSTLTFNDHDTIHIPLARVEAQPDIDSQLKEASEPYTTLSSEAERWAEHMFEKIGIIKMDCSFASTLVFCGVTTISHDVISQIWDINADYTDFQIEPLTAWSSADNGALTKFYELNGSEVIVVGFSDNLVLISAFRAGYYPN